MSIKDSKKNTKTEQKKEYLALKTIKVKCNKEFQLVEGKPIPMGIGEKFISSLVNSNLIK